MLERWQQLDIRPGDQVAIRLAGRFGLTVSAIELDPVMAELAQRRIDEAGAGDRVSLTVGRAAAVLRFWPGWRLASWRWR